MLIGFYERKRTIDKPRINEEIIANELRLIDQNGQSLGIINRDQALYLAYDLGVDLVEISAKSTPRVAKLIDSGKYQYELQKKEAKQRSHQKTSELKEIRLGLKINNHDFDTKVRKSQSFLNEGNKVKVTVILRGRENIFPERAFDMINRFTQMVQAQIDQQPNKLGNRISAVLVKQNNAQNKNL